MSPLAPRLAVVSVASMSRSQPKPPGWERLALLARLDWPDGFEDRIERFELEAEERLDDWHPSRAITRRRTARRLLERLQGRGVLVVGREAVDAFAGIRSLRSAFRGDGDAVPWFHVERRAARGAGLEWIAPHPSPRLRGLHSSPLAWRAALFWDEVLGRRSRAAHRTR